MNVNTRKVQRNYDLPTMTPEALVERARYLREWRQRNKDKTREYRRNYWERKAQQRREAGENELDQRKGDPK